MTERIAVLVPAALGTRDMKAAIELLKETFEVDKGLPAAFNKGLIYPVEAERQEVESFMDATNCIEWL